MAEEKDKIRISLSVQQAIAVVSIVAALVGAPLSINKFNPDARSDPFTGTQGQELDDRISYLELVVTNIVQADNECKKRLDAHLEFSANKVRELDVRLERHSIKLEECLHRTGVK